MSKRESTLKEVESNTRELRELLDQHKISGTSLDLSDDVKVCAPSQLSLSPPTGGQCVLVNFLPIFQLKFCLNIQNEA